MRFLPATREPAIEHEHVWNKRETTGWQMIPLWKCIICGLVEEHSEEIKQ